MIGLFRDLRGIALATNSRRTYGERRQGCPNAEPRLVSTLWQAGSMHVAGGTCTTPLMCWLATVRARVPAAGMLFDWLYPTHFPTIICCLEAWAGKVSAGCLWPDCCRLSAAT